LEPLEHHAAIFEVVNVYRTVVYNYYTVIDASYRRKTELYSRELLLTWIAYCITFTAARSEYSSLSHMGVCLRYQDVEPLVLSEKRLWTIAFLVKKFLDESFVSKHELFSLRCPSATLRAGEDFAKRYLSNEEQVELQDSKQRANKYWKKVEEMKAKLARLRNELADLESDEAAIVSSLDQAQREYNGSVYYDTRGYRQHGTRETTELNRQNRLFNDISINIQSKKREIKNARVPPEPVIQPLPSDQSLARQWLFFLHMPRPLRTLQALSFLSQQLLAPRLGNLAKMGFSNSELHSIRKELTSSSPRDSLRSHYNEHHKPSVYLPNSCGLHAAESIVELMGTTELTIPKPLQDLDQIRNLGDGVWYPNEVYPRMAWSGGPSTDDCPSFEFDPFRVSRSTSSLLFTERLTRDVASLQWMMLQAGSSPLSRGNMPIATQGAKPSHLNTSEYLTLGKMRSFPFIQLRNLLVALSDDLLPLSRTEVQAILSQLAFQLGDVSRSDDEEKCFRWKTDLYSAQFTKFSVPLFTSIANRLRETPTLYDHTIVISELSAFFSAWDSSGKLRAVTKTLAKALYDWSLERGGDSVSPESLKMSATDATDGDMSGRSCFGESELMRLLYLQHAIICLGCRRPLPDDRRDLDDFGELIRLSVLCHNLTSNGTALSDEASVLHYRCAESIFSCLDDVLYTARQRPEFITRALKSVVRECPDSLDWVEFDCSPPGGSACFRAAAGAKLYAVNILTGVVLIDGIPPTKLPPQIRGSVLYKDVFGQLDFDVVHSSGVFETSVPVNDKTFSFRLGGSELLVKENDLSSGMVLELLDHGNIETWGSDLPIRLKRLYHFWASVDRSIVFVRKKSFRSRVTKYVIRLDPNRQGGNPVECRVYEVPPKYEDDIQRIISATDANSDGNHFDMLVKLPSDSPILGVVEKFEDPAFIHALIESNSAMRLDLPRYQLSLNHQGDSLSVREFKGFVLAQKQVLEGTLHGFTKYLVLEKRSGFPKQVCVLFPEGTIQRCSNGETLLSTPSSSCDATLRFHRLNVHSRYGTLHGLDSMAMLRAAALHAATSLEAVDSLSDLRGSDRALELVRQSFTASPLSEDELIALDNVATVCRGRFPAVRLACKHIRLSSEQVSFLYRDMSAESF
jgi:hypothetical protein